MKVKLLFVIFLTLFLNTSFAIQIKNGTLISHKEWTTGNVNVNFKDIGSKKTKWPPQYPFPPKLIYPEQFSVKTHIGDQEGIIDKENVIMGDSEVIIANHSSVPQNYQIRMVICSEFQERSSFCGIADDNVKLEAGGYILLGRSPFITITYKQLGTFKTGIYTYVVKETENAADKSILFASYDEGTINVSR